jgi:hypothetical protein
LIDILTLKISWKSHCFNKQKNLIWCITKSVYYKFRKCCTIYAKINDVSNSFKLMKWTNHNENLVYEWHKKDLNNLKSNWIHKNVDEHIRIFISCYISERKKKTIHEFDSKRKIRIVCYTKTRNIAFDINIWFVK